MQVAETSEGWTFHFTDARVGLIQVDFRFSIQVAESDQTSLMVVIEAPFDLSSNGETSEIEPEDTTSVAPALTLFNTPVEEIVARKDGELQLRFDDNVSIQVSPLEAHEASHILRSGSMLICQPGGSVAVFGSAGLVGNAR